MYLGDLPICRPIISVLDLRNPTEYFFWNITAIQERQSTLVTCKVKMKLLSIAMATTAAFSTYAAAGSCSGGKKPVLLQTTYHPPHNEMANKHVQASPSAAAPPPSVAAATSARPAAATPAAASTKRAPSAVPTPARSPASTSTSLILPSLTASASLQRIHRRTMSPRTGRPVLLPLQVGFLGCGICSIAFSAAGCKDVF